MFRQRAQIISTFLSCLHSLATIPSTMAYFRITFDHSTTRHAVVWWPEWSTQFVQFKSNKGKKLILCVYVMKSHPIILIFHRMEHGHPCCIQNEEMYWLNTFKLNSRFMKKKKFSLMSWFRDAIRSHPLCNFWLVHQESAENCPMYTQLYYNNIICPKFAQ